MARWCAGAMSRSTPAMRPSRCGARWKRSLAGDARGSNELSEIVEFDYVIVGAGSAGCVLANRLSADGKNSVLLLEARPDDTNLWIHVPLAYGMLFKAKSVNWMYQTEPEPRLNGRKVCPHPGQVLRGS